MYRAKSAVTVVGAGSQGRRLAFMWSRKGNDVHLVDDQVTQLKDSVRAVDKFRQSTPVDGVQGNIRTFSTKSLHEALKSSWLAIECVPERLGLKQEVIGQLDHQASEDTIIASNSSSFSCSNILESVTWKHPSRILSAHTYWPPETSVIEIMGHETTDRKHVETMMKECARHGFHPFHVRKPSMGYIYNRIWAAIKREALLTASEGAAAPEEIDAIFKGVLKTEQGPFEMMDKVGLDVVLDIERHYALAREGIPATPQQYLRAFVDKGQLGVKSGSGFYQYGNTVA